MVDQNQTQKCPQCRPQRHRPIVALLFCDPHDRDRVYERLGREPHDKTCFKAPRHAFKADVGTIEIAFQPIDFILQIAKLVVNPFGVLLRGHPHGI